MLRARQLIVDSNLTMTEIADIAGFGSLRRFNDAMKQAYGQAPTAFRRGIKAKALDKPTTDDPFAARNDDLILRLRARQPFDADYLLAFFRARAIPGLETVRDRIYVRGFKFDGRVGLMICHFSADQSGVDVILRGPAREAVLEIGARVRRLFDLDADVPSITTQFAEDALLAPLVEKRPGLRVPGCWDRFELALRAVLGQQVSVAAARTLAGRLVARFGEALPDDLVDGTGITHVFPTPQSLIGQELMPIGLTTRRAETLADVIDLFASPDCDQKSGDELIAIMTAIKGIGPWTLNYFGLRGLGDPDAFPAADLGILKASGMGGGPDKPKALESISENWRPWRAYAAQYLWSALEGE